MNPPTPATLPVVPRAASTATDTPMVEGRYVLDREIAGGGMGRIFEGRDRLLGRTVAIKTTRDARGAERFEQEVRLAARLQHPGIVTVYDAGFLPTGEPFLVMKRVLGRSLDRVIADADSLEERLALLPSLTAAVDALAYAHDQGVIHRDLKPSNIIVGAFGETVVVDFGLAKEVSAVEAVESSELHGGGGPGITQEGTVMGTPAYMAPEQAAGESVDTRADVYALGAVIHQMLTGQAPAPNVTLRSLEPRLPAELVAIVSKAMALDKRARYPSAFELAEDLKRFQTGGLVAAHRYSPLARVARVARRQRWLVGLVIAVGALLALHWLRGR